MLDGCLQEVETTEEFIWLSITPVEHKWETYIRALLEGNDMHVSSIFRSKSCPQTAYITL
jgi:hypothetical protein